MSGGGNGLGTHSSGPFTPIACQISIDSLTLDELPNTFGPLEEHLETMWTPEESHAIPSAVASTNESNSPQQCSGGGISEEFAYQGSLPHLVSLPRNLKDIERGAQMKTTEQQQQKHYAEMTSSLEGPLVKAGVVSEGEKNQPTTSATRVGALSRVPPNFPFGHGGEKSGGFEGTSSMARVTHQATMEAIAYQNLQHPWLNHHINTASLEHFQLLFLQQRAHAAAAAAAAGFPNAVEHRGPPPVALPGTSAGSGRDGSLDAGQLYSLQQRACAASAGFPNATGHRGPPLVALPGTSAGSGTDRSSDGGEGHGNKLWSSPAITTPDTRTQGKKQNQDEGERHLKRKMKNRESAANSRLKKHAYTEALEAENKHLKEEIARTVALEAENTHLKEEIASLKKQETPENLVP